MIEIPIVNMDYREVRAFFQRVLDAFGAPVQGPNNYHSILVGKPVLWDALELNPMRLCDRWIPRTPEGELWLMLNAPTFIKEVP